MKKTISLTLLLLALSIVSTSAQTQKEIRQWARQGLWRNGFTAAKPHSTVNLTEFYQQYHKNPAQWEALFRWLSQTDLLNIPKGRHPI